MLWQPGTRQGPGTVRRRCMGPGTRHLPLRSLVSEAGTVAWSGARDPRTGGERRWEEHSAARGVGASGGGAAAAPAWGAGTGTAAGAARIAWAAAAAAGAVPRTRVALLLLLLPLLLTSLLSTLPLPAAADKISPLDMLVLMKLKKLYQSKINLQSWSAGNDCSAWKYIGCDADRVSAVYFQGTQLEGPFPTIVTKLTGLRLWYGDANNFTGPFPSGFSALTKLQVLRLSGNLLRGPLPASFSRLTGLYKFYVKENRLLTGTIPPSWGKLNFQEAYFDSNQFSGPFPTVICNWSFLQRIRMGNNQWTGSIPNCITKLTGLVNLYLDGIGLTGKIPPGIGALTNLELLVMGGNKLTGPIPPSIGNLKNLKTLFLSANKITGPLPKSMAKLKGCEEWVMEFNHIGGTIPNEIGQMTSLKRILLDGNRLSGPIPASLGNLKQLTILLLQGNRLSGKVPASIASGCKSLVQFNLESNWLTGTPPTGFASSSLTQINIRSNYFVGGMDYKTQSGKKICPPLSPNAWTHSSTMYNCLTKKSSCGPKYDEVQRPKSTCQAFCGALGPKGTCNGKGTCVYLFHGKKRQRAVCACQPGTKRTKNGLSCV